MQTGERGRSDGQTKATTMLRDELLRSGRHWPPTMSLVQLKDMTSALAAPSALRPLGCSSLLLVSGRSTLLVLRKLGWGYEIGGLAETPAQPGCFSTNMKPTSSWWCYNLDVPRSQETRRIQQHVCPDIRECYRLIRTVASFDNILFKEANRRLNRDIAASGRSFSSDLAAMRTLRMDWGKWREALRRGLGKTRCMWVVRSHHVSSPSEVPRAGRVSTGTSSAPRRSSGFECSYDWAHAPAQNFSDPSACFAANQGVMETVWRQHSNKKPVMDLLKVGRNAVGSGRDRCVRQGYRIGRVRSSAFFG
mmetsp:Transcript_9336/g.28291  ORF Transcript_9336/g.28291 Transcript_9336/m.28291 type:complete len:306 (-) Transcript_9336:57-974(-)